MTVPAFTFTDRATPIVQIGRSEHRTSGDSRWGRAHWGADRWGARDWEPVWTDLTCEIHEITTDTGRAGAVDRFVPGTAEIVASNMHGVSKMIWPPLPPPPNPFEFVPQPPVTHEEDLQAPNAATVISNGWSFSDDFETLPPHWRFPAQFATTGTYPTRPFVWHDGYISPEMYSDTSAENYEAHGKIQWGPPIPDTVPSDISVLVDAFHWAATPTGGTPRIVYELYCNGNRTDRSCNCVRITLTPVFGGDNTGTVQIFTMAADGSGSGTPASITGGGLDLLGSNGQFPAMTLFAGSQEGATSGGIVDVESFFAGLGTPATGDRIGFAVHYVEGDIPAGTSEGAPHVIGASSFDMEDDFTRPTGSGWGTVPHRGLGPMIMEGGSMRPPMTFTAHPAYGGDYRGEASAQWVSNFDGDQFIEVDLAGMNKTVDLDGTDETFLELRCKGNARDRACVRANIDYMPDFSEDTTTIVWGLSQEARNGTSYYPGVDGIISQPFGDLWPDPSHWRLEADTAGDVRLYYRGTLLGEFLFPDIPTGDRIGLTLMAGAGRPPDGVTRPMDTRLEQVWGGLREPLGTEDLGTWVRIGVDHATLGERWFFRGFVDGIVPTYVPDHADAVRIECIDSLGEAGRAGVIDTWLPNQFAAAPTRIRQLLNAAHWPKNLRRIGDDSTQMSRPADGKAVDGLTRVAESCGGAVYGDPVSGDIVFKGTDWQGTAASLPPLAVLTNFHTEGVDEAVPRVCPTGWELSKRRGDILTRVRLSSETSETVDGEPIVKEWRSPEMELIYGVELYEATVLAISAERINELAVRQLRVRGARDTPRVQAVLLDAATADEALDLMTTATFTIPSKYRCSHYADDDAWAFNTNYLVTGVRHRILPGQWTCRLALDLSAPFHETGGRWGSARWGVDHWGKTR